ncbi:MAG: Rod shape-determining protein MreB [Parcubacteria group bacterium Gr01-1014_20]|nr:MAG: Rod shape-determining protein MreB [Parcubacteria group bacterium Gr01-1014_20]
MALLDNFFKDVGIDLGTANSLVYLKGRGVVVNEPTVVAMNNKTNQILAVGDDAKRMLGRTPTHIRVVRPLVSGVISDFEMTQEIIRSFLKRVSKNSAFSFRKGILAIPDNLTEVERKSVEDAAINGGCGKVYLIQSPVSAALGANLPIHLPTASLIVDIGGGTTDIAVISMGGTVVSKTLKVAGDRFNEDIIGFIKEEFKLDIGEPTAELAKVLVGSAMPHGEKLEVNVRGRDFSSGLPREILVKDTHIRAALAKSIKSIVDSVKEAIEMTPPELTGDMLKQGIYLCGGGALLRGLPQLIERETSVETSVVDDPLTCVVRGLGKIVDRFDDHRELLNNPLKPMTINL